MAQPKTLLFLGRKDPDTGYEFCVDMAKKNKWTLSAKEGISNPQQEIVVADYIFAGGYLVALESFLAKKIVLASFNNPVKKDYWLMHPMSKYIGFNGIVPKNHSDEAYFWAKDQTWDKLASQYETLWQK